MKKLISLFVIMVLLLTAGIASAQDAEKSGKNETTYVELKNGAGKVIGHATLKQVGNHVKLKVKASELSPGKHGFHIHANPILYSAEGIPNFGGPENPHFNPTGASHGEHLGDLPNLVVNKNGEVNQTIHLKGVSLIKEKTNSLLGRSIIIHQDADDGVTDPSGNSGPRIAGGNIE